MMKSELLASRDLCSINFFAVYMDSDYQINNTSLTTYGSPEIIQSINKMTIKKKIIVITDKKLMNQQRQNPIH